MNNNIQDIKPPEGLNERQIKVAKALVDNDLHKRLPQAEFCKTQYMSTATLHKWLKNPTFSNYVQELKGEMISQDELEAYEVVKKHIIKRVNSDNPTEKEINLFLDNFQYVVHYQQQKAMEKLGISPNGKNGGTVDINEKKQSLLARLRERNGEL